MKGRQRSTNTSLLRCAPNDTPHTPGNHRLHTGTAPFSSWCLKAPRPSSRLAPIYPRRQPQHAQLVTSEPLKHAWNVKITERSSELKALRQVCRLWHVVARSKVKTWILLHSRDVTKQETLRKPRKELLLSKMEKICHLLVCLPVSLSFYYKAINMNKSSFRNLLTHFWLQKYFLWLFVL